MSELNPSTTQLNNNYQTRFYTKPQSPSTNKKSPDYTSRETLPVQKSYQSNSTTTSTKSLEDEWIQRIKIDPNLFKTAPQEIRGNRIIAFEASKASIDNLSYVSDELIDDEQFMLEIIRYYGELHKTIDPNSMDNIKHGTPGMAITFASTRLQKDRNFVLQAVSIDGHILRYLPKFQDDEEVVLKSIDNYPNSFHYASERLKANKDLVTYAVSRGTALSFLNDEHFLEDKEFGKSLLHISPIKDFAALSQKVRSDPEIGMEIVIIQKDLYDNNQDPNNYVYPGLYYLSDNLKNNKEFVLEAIKIDPRNIFHISKELSKDPEVGMEIVKIQKELYDNNPDKGKDYPAGLYYLSDELKNDKNFVLEAIRIDPRNIKYVSEELKNDTDFTRNIVFSTNFSIYEHLGNKQKEAFRGEFEKALNVLKIDVVDRFKELKKVNEIELMEKIVCNRYSVSSSEIRSQLEEIFPKEFYEKMQSNDKPICVVIYNEYDWNGAFENDFDQMLYKFLGNYKLIYYDVKTDEELAKCLREATIENGQKADVCIISGHGTKFGLTLGEQQEGLFSYLSSVINSFLIILGLPIKRAYPEDFDIFDRFMIDKCRESISSDGAVILCACSTGEGRDANKGVSNLAEFAHEIWPQAHIYSAPAISYGFAPQFDSNGNLIDVKFKLTPSEGKMDSYHIAPSQSMSSRPRYDLTTFVNYIFQFFRGMFS